MDHALVVPKTRRALDLDIYIYFFKKRSVNIFGHFIVGYQTDVGVSYIYIIP